MVSISARSLAVDLGKMGKIEAKPVRRNQRTGLLDMVTQNFSQGRMKKMGGRMIAGGCATR